MIAYTTFSPSIAHLVEYPPGDYQADNIEKDKFKIKQMISCTCLYTENRPKNGGSLCFKYLAF